MSIWDDRLAKHGLWQAISAARDLVNATEELAVEAEPLGGHDRLRRFLDFIEGRVKSADTQLVAETVLDSIAGSIESIRGELEQFELIGIAGHLTNAHTYVDQAIQTASQIPVLASTRDAEEMQTAALGFRRSVGQLARRASDEVEAVTRESEKLRVQVEEQGKRIVAQDTRLDTVIQQAQAQFAEVQSRAQTDLNDAVSSAQTEVKSLVAAAQKELDDAVTAGTSALKNLLEETRTATTASVTEMKGRVTEALDEIKLFGEERLTKLDALHERAVKTVGAIGATAMSGGYQLAAKREEDEADKLRKVTIWALIAAALVSLGSLALSVFWDFEWGTLVTKAFAAVPLLLLAGYVASESGKHREQARIARQIEQQLASLDSYLAVLDDADQHEIKKHLADRFFGFIPSKGDKPSELPASSSE